MRLGGDLLLPENLTNMVLQYSYILVLAIGMVIVIIGGHIDLFLATPQQVIGQFASGEVKVFGITSKDTSPQFPGVPSFVAAYGPKLNIDFWQIMLAPAGTPKPIVDALDVALQEAMDDP